MHSPLRKTASNLVLALVTVGVLMDWALSQVGATGVGPRVNMNITGPAPTALPRITSVPPSQP